MCGGGDTGCKVCVCVRGYITYCTHTELFTMNALLYYDVGVLWLWYISDYHCCGKLMNDYANVKHYDFKTEQKERRKKNNCDKMIKIKKYFDILPLRKLIILTSKYIYV